jgi:hypothetical protein
MSRFDEFWKLYPRREGRKACETKWEQKKLDAIADTIVGHLTTRVKSDKKWRDGFVPMPLTFLNQERWTDEYETIQPKQRPQEARPQEEVRHGQPCPYKAHLNRLMLKLLRNNRGVDTDTLRRFVATRNKIVAEMRRMWGEDPNTDEYNELMPAYVRKLEAVL